MLVAAVQTNLFWENSKKNFAHIEQLLKHTNNIDLIVLPEMFPSGFSMNPISISEPENGPTFKWMQALSREKKAVVIGSVAIRREKKFFNSLLWVTPDGKYNCYDKRHLFRMAGEHNYYEEGKELMLESVASFKCCPLICYDLRFPVWSRNIKKDQSFKYDVLIYIANWPSPRIDAWITLLKARAIENQAFVIGVNRVGVDGNNVDYCGESRIFDPKGDRMDKFESNQEQVEIVHLNKSFLEKYRKDFPVHLDADMFKII